VVIIAKKEGTVGGGLEAPCIKTALGTRVQGSSWMTGENIKSDQTVPPDLVKGEKIM